MIRVLHCVDAMNQGGLETFIMNIYRNIDRSKVQFDFLVHTDKKGYFDDEIFSLGGKIFHIVPRYKGVIKNQKSLKNFFEKNKNYKIIHQHSSSLSYITPTKVARKYDVPIRIVHSHSTQEGGSFLHKYIHKYNQLFIKSNATHFIACSDLAAVWMFGNKNYKNNFVEIINNGIETKEFIYSLEKRNKLQKDLMIDGKFVIGHVGRLSYPKNHEFLINLFNTFTKEIPNSVLLLVGDGELREQIQQQIINLNLENKVLLTGKRNDIADLLQSMDVFVFPSHFEGLPVSLVEAQASGLPCIVSDNITKQVAITENIEYLNLDSPIYNWVNKIIRIKESYVRIDQSERVKEFGFDINLITKKMEDFYLNSLKL